MEEQLSNAKVPKSLIGIGEEDLSKELQIKLAQTSDRVLAGRSVLLLGTPSREKDVFAVCLLKRVIQNNKTGLFYLASHTLDYEEAYATVFLGIDDMTSGYPVKKLLSTLKYIFMQGRVFILEGNSKESLEQTLGRDFITYIVPGSVGVEFDEKQDTLELI